MLLKSRLVNLGAGMARHYRKWWAAYLLVAASLIAFGSHYKLAFNVTDSLPGKVYLVVKGELPTRNDEPMAFVWRDPQHKTQYPDGITFLKLAAGMPGDVVERDGKAITVRGWRVTPKDFSRRGMKLDPNEFAGNIPEGRYFVVGIHPDSLDSRYALVGLVPQADVIGRAYAIF